jgi:hypothetical protein
MHRYFYGTPLILIHYIAPHYKPSRKSCQEKNAMKSIQAIDCLKIYQTETAGIEKRVSSRRGRIYLQTIDCLHRQPPARPWRVSIREWEPPSLLRRQPRREQLWMAPIRIFDAHLTAVEMLCQAKNTGILSHCTLEYRYSRAFLDMCYFICVASPAATGVESSKEISFACIGAARRLEQMLNEGLEEEKQ